jgi:hypothetical protein
MYGISWHAGKPRMVLFYLPSSSGAITGPNVITSTAVAPPKPKRLACSLRLKDGLRAALLGTGRIDSLNVFYLN